MVVRLSGVEGACEPADRSIHFRSPEVRRSFQAMAADPEAAIDPELVGLPEETVIAVFKALSPVFVDLNRAESGPRSQALERHAARLGVPRIEELETILMGAAAWAQAHPPRSRLLADLYASQAHFGRGWPSRLPQGLRDSLLARALFYSRRPAWRQIARDWATNEAGGGLEPKHADDLFLWMAGLVEWGRCHSERINYFTTGELRDPVLAVLGIPREDEACLDGLVRSAFVEPAEPWHTILIRTAGLEYLPAQHLVDLVRKLHQAGPEADAEPVFERWTHTAFERVGAFREPFRREAIFDVATRLTQVLWQYEKTLFEATLPEEFEDRVTVQRRRLFAWTSYFASTDIPEAFEALRGLARDRVTPLSFDSMTIDLDETSPEAALEALAELPPPGVVSEEEEQALEATWRYGSDLLFRQPILGYRVLLPIIDAHWLAYHRGFFDLLSRHAPSSDGTLAEVVDVLDRPERRLVSADALLEALDTGCPSKPCAKLLTRLLARLDGPELGDRLDRFTRVLLGGRGELSFLFCEAIAFREKLGQLDRALDVCLIWREDDPRAGVEPLVHATRVARTIADWDRGGARLLDAALQERELVDSFWAGFLDLCKTSDKLPQALEVVLRWAVHPTTITGSEKTREAQINEWKTSLEVAAQISDWDLGFSLVLFAAQEARCPVPEVWQTLVLEAQVRGLPEVVRSCAKRFIEAWGRSFEITLVLWAVLETEAHSAVPAEDEFVDLMHWLHVDLGHNRWTSEEEFVDRVVSRPKMSPRALARWATRRFYSSRRWMLLTKAFIRRQDSLAALLAAVLELGCVGVQTLEGVLSGLPDPIDPAAISEGVREGLRKLREAIVESGPRIEALDRQLDPLWDAE